MFGQASKLQTKVFIPGIPKWIFLVVESHDIQNWTWQLKQPGLIPSFIDERNCLYVNDSLKAA